MNIDLDGVVAHFLAPLTQALDQLVFADESSGTLQQHFEQAELARRQLDHVAVNRGHAAGLVIDHGPVFDGAGRPAHAATAECTHARLELLQAEGLGHVVVGPVVQALDALFNAVGGGEDQHRHGRAARPQAFEHLQPVHARQAQVQDQQVKLGVGHQRGIALTAAGHVVDRRTRGPQGSQQTIGQHLVIFGNQYPHRCLLV